MSSDTNVTRYLIVCGFCIVMCLIVVKETFYQNLTFVTLTSRDFSVQKFSEIGNNMIGLLLGVTSSATDAKYKMVTTSATLRKKLKGNFNLNDDPSFNVKPKIILWYVKPRFIQYSSKLFKISNCKWNCVETTNRDYFNQSDALLFVAQTMRIPPPQRSNPNQVFVLHNHEAPTNNWRKKPSFRKPKWRHQINWTMFYRLDSDIVYPYGKIRKRLHVPRKNYTKIIKAKRKLVAWMVSHCKTNSRREKYVTKLRKYINVDIWGKCGRKCSRNSETKCRKLITKDYKFYLSFENALCDDYVTEKFFRQYNEDLITVVRGGKTYHEIAPKGVYINTADFKTPRDLAMHLKYLDGNDTAYEDMLRRKDHYEALFEKYELRSGRHILYTNYHYKMAAMCSLCQRLWNVDKNRKVYDDINSWFDSKLCVKPTDF